jgi:hypothetical protein
MRGNLIATISTLKQTVDETKSLYEAKFGHSCQGSGWHQVHGDNAYTGVQQEALDFNKSNDAIGEYKASECAESAQRPALRLELR